LNLVDNGVLSLRSPLIAASAFALRFAEPEPEIGMNAATLSKTTKTISSIHASVSSGSAQCITFDHYIISSSILGFNAMQKADGVFAKHVLQE
jgi:hypothetical protein